MLYVVWYNCKKICILPTKFIYVFVMILAIKIDCVRTQNSAT